MKRLNKTAYVAAAILSAACISVSCGTAGKIENGSNSYDSDEVVNVGYGTMTRSEMTNNSNIISSENAPNIAYKSVAEYLQGKVAGVQVTDNGDSEPTIIIRGAGTLNSGTKPLYILDGIEISSLLQINPNDIYSVEVLRDASASIYGVKAANGVLIFTSKSRHDLDEQERLQRQAARQAKKEAKKK